MTALTALWMGFLKNTIYSGGCYGITQIVFWTGFFGRYFIEAVLLLGLVLAFVHNQTRKNIIIAGMIACLLAIFINFAGDLDGRLLIWPLTEFLLLFVSVPNLIVFVLAILLTIWRQWNTKKCFTKVLPWVSGVLFGLILCLTLPTEIKEQYEIQKIAKEMTTKQFFELPEYDQREITYKIVGMKLANVFACLQYSQNKTEAQDKLIRDEIENCRWYIID